MWSKKSKFNERIIVINDNRKAINIAMDMVIGDPDYYMGIQKMLLFNEELRDCVFLFNSLDEKCLSAMSDVYKSIDATSDNEILKRNLFKNVVMNISNTLDYAQQTIYFAYRMHEYEINSRKKFNDANKSLRGGLGQIIRYLAKHDTEYCGELINELNILEKSESLKRIKELSNKVKHRASSRFSDNDIKYTNAYKMLNEDNGEILISTEFCKEEIIAISDYDEDLSNSIGCLINFHNYLIKLLDIEMFVEIMLHCSTEIMHELVQEAVPTKYFSRKIYTPKITSHNKPVSETPVL